MRHWFCRIGETEDLPPESDQSMRNAASVAYKLITGKDADFIFSGWGDELPEEYRAVVEDREPNKAHFHEWTAQQTLDKLAQHLKEFGTVVLNYDTDRQWFSAGSLSRETEAPDSPMAAGAAYGLHEDFRQCLERLMEHTVRDGNT